MVKESCIFAGQGRIGGVRLRRVNRRYRVSTPAGWHKQPDGRERYWDGQQWTDQYREASASAPPPPAAEKKKSGCLKWVLIAVVAIAVIALLSSLLGGGDDDGTPTGSSGTTQTQGAAAPDSEEPAAEPPMEVTAQQLIDDLEANALAASNKYKGKRVIVTGKVENIDASGDYFTITGTEDFTFTNVQVFIDDSLVETVSGFTTGQDVTVTGVITDVGEILGYSIEAESIG